MREVKQWARLAEFHQLCQRSAALPPELGLDRPDSCFTLAVLHFSGSCTDAPLFAPMCVPVLLHTHAPSF